MARMRIVQRGPLFIPLYVQCANERDGDGVGSDDVAVNGGVIAGSADVPEKDEKSVGGFSGPIHSTEPEDESKHDADLTVAAVEPHKEASDVLKAAEEIHSTDQGRPESCGILPSAPLKRGLRGIATPVPDSDNQQATKRAKRASNWTPQETEALIKLKLQPSLPKGNEGWEHISSQISGRPTQRCRERWETVQKSYKKIKGYCVAHGKELSQVSKEEFLTMKLDMTFFTNVDWYKMIDDYSSRPTIIFSGLAANELNHGASTSTHPVGKPNPPSSACPNLEVSRPELMPAAFSVEQMPAAVELEGWTQHDEAGIFIDNYVAPIQRRGARKQNRCCSTYGGYIWIRFSFIVNCSRRLPSSSSSQG